MEFAIFFIIIVFVSIFQIAVPFFVKRTVVFGVTIPYEKAQYKQIIRFKRIYATVTSFVSILVTVLFIGWSRGTEQNETEIVLTGIILPFIILMTGLTLYFYFHFKMQRLKKEQNWYSGIKQVRYADLALRSKDEMLPTPLFMVPSIISIALIILTASLYDQLPAQIPTHWGPDGQPDAFTDKSWMAALGLPIMLVLLQWMFVGINYFTKQSGIKINAGNVSSSKLRQLSLRKYTSWFLFVVSVVITLLFSFLQLNLLYENLFQDSWIMITPLIIMTILLAGAFILAVKVGRIDSDFEGAQVLEGNSKVEGLDEDRFWKGGLIYFNPEDPSIFVEKRFGLGWTMNFARPVGYFILLGPVALIIIISIFIV
ncbi:hypothetical protein Q73_01960 [Bacillus coahuilensis m2-6]|uniref:DUF1648 domain-containing protein n=1 Tax=Bacillus coahuilensis TaxID=408580 RepID=UPI00075047B9|nr:DUF5808 domain-containing protein [Bacillus coahuilensis]KUP09669.1 hypothetical protein Q73_01960 [Bacillus coahuilensis m2-6]